MTLERRHNQSIVNSLIDVPAPAISLNHQPEEHADGAVQKGAVPILFAGRLGTFGQIPERLEAVAFYVNIFVHRGIAEFRSCLDIEEKEKPVHESQTFLAELLFSIAPFENIVCSQLNDRFISNQLYRFPQAELQVFGHREGVFV